MGTFPNAKVGFFDKHFRKLTESALDEAAARQSLVPGTFALAGNAAKKFNQVDTYVWQRLHSLRFKRAGRNLQPAQVSAWSRGYFQNLGLVRLHGTVQYPEAA